MPARHRVGSIDLDHRLLLRGAVDATTASGNAIDIDLNNLTFRKQALKCLPCSQVGFEITKFRRDDGAIANVEIDVTRRKMVAGKLFPNR